MILILTMNIPDIAFVAKHQVIVVLPFDILKIMEVMDIGRSHGMAVYDSTCSTDCVELILAIKNALFLKKRNQ